MAEKNPACGVSPKEPPGVDALSYEVYLSFMAALHLHRSLMARTFAGAGGHMGQAGALRILAVNDGLSQRDLAEKMHVARPTVTIMLQGMEANGMIERRPDERDQRVTRVYLTQEGRALEERAQEALGRYINETIGAMTERDREELKRLLGEFASNTTKALEE